MINTISAGAAVAPLVQTLLDPATTPVAAHHAVSQLHAWCAAVSGVHGDVLTRPHDGETYLDGGLAVSPNTAAACLLDPPRTIGLLRGVQSALLTLQARFPAERLEVVYAGTGPYGTLLVPLLPLFSAESLAVTLIDIHPASVTAVGRIVKALGVADRVRAVVCADAITYRHSAQNRPIHLIISETMQAALTHEPQVAILLNLVPQLHPHGLIVPQRIIIDGWLSDSAAEDVHRLRRRDPLGYPLAPDAIAAAVAARTYLGRVLDVNCTTIRRWHQQETLPAVRLTLPQSAKPADQLLLSTHLEMPGAVRLTDYACELTQPRRVHGLGDLTPAGRSFTLSYRHTGRHPRFIAQAQTPIVDTRPTQ
jgi:hypothetical protein